ncbi:MAG: hypothetical protein PUA89_02465, partial [Frisingicoccus sp.]|uniref:hypothetical protein n=1 Tax=Frisingicoccus sp. TaxID=1918627 RepID=UPI0026198051
MTIITISNIPEPAIKIGFALPFLLFGLCRDEAFFRFFLFFCCVSFFTKVILCRLILSDAGFAFPYDIIDGFL